MTTTRPHRGSFAWLGSLAVHLTCVFGLTMWTLSPSPQPHIDASVAEWVVETGKPLKDVPEWIIEPEALSPGGGGGMVAPAGDFGSVTGVSMPSSSAIPGLSELPPTPSPKGTPSPGRSAPGAKRGQNGNGEQGEGKGRRGRGLDDGPGFFGGPLDKTSYVFVVDASQSMNRPHDSEAKTRFRRLQFEIVDTIAKMAPTQKFFLIYFNEQAYPMPARELQPAAPAVQQHYLKWAASLTASGRTDPRTALRLALQLKPDVIYFLTDGRFDRVIENELRTLSQFGPRIDTFALGDDGGEAVMRQIARQNGGQFTFIP